MTYLVEHFVGPVAFDRLAGEWDELVQRSQTNTPFQSLAYQRAWWTHLGPGELHTLAARDAAGRLSGLGCFFRHAGRLHFNGCIEETDYLDLIAPADEAAGVWAALFDRLSGADFPAWDGLTLCNVPAASASREILPVLAATRGFSFAAYHQEVCPILTLPASFEAYLESLDKQQRHELRRKLRRAEGAEARVSQVTQAEAVSAAVDDFLTLLQKSTPDKESWLNPGRRAVFHAVAHAAHADGTLQLLFLEVEGQRVAALFNFDYQGRIWVYNSGLDPQAHAYLSPGVVLTARAIEQAILAGRTIFDFLRGSETYKYRFGAQDTFIYRLEIDRSA